EDRARWLWRAHWVTHRQYPEHGTNEVAEGKLTGATDTDYFHLNCPRCGPEEPERDLELLGVRDDTSWSHPNARTVLVGLACPTCGLHDLVKIGCLGGDQYQPRRPARSSAS